MIVLAVAAHTETGPGDFNEASSAPLLDLSLIHLVSLFAMYDVNLMC